MVRARLQRRAGKNCIKIGLPGKLILSNSFSLENSIRESIFREDLFLYNCLQTNYSYLTKAYAEEREKTESRVKDIEGLDAIAYEPDITIYNFTK